MSDHPIPLSNNEAAPSTQDAQQQQQEEAMAASMEAILMLEGASTFPVWPSAAKAMHVTAPAAATEEPPSGSGNSVSDSQSVDSGHYSGTEKSTTSSGDSSSDFSAQENYCTDFLKFFGAPRTPLKRSSDNNNTKNNNNNNKRQRQSVVPSLQNQIQSSIRIQSWWRKILAQQQYATMQLCQGLLTILQPRSAYRELQYAVAALQAKTQKQLVQRGMLMSSTNADKTTTDNDKNDYDNNKQHNIQDDTSRLSDDGNSMELAFSTPLKSNTNTDHPRTIEHMQNIQRENPTKSHSNDNLVALDSIYALQLAFDNANEPHLPFSRQELLDNASPKLHNTKQQQQQQRDQVNNNVSPLPARVEVSEQHQPAATSHVDVFLEPNSDDENAEERETVEEEISFSSPKESVGRIWNFLGFGPSQDVHEEGDEGDELNSRDSDAGEDDQSIQSTENDDVPSTRSSTDAQLADDDKAMKTTSRIRPVSPVESLLSELSQDSTINDTNENVVSSALSTPPTKSVPSAAARAVPLVTPSPPHPSPGLSENERNAVLSLQQWWRRILIQRQLETLRVCNTILQAVQQHRGPSQNSTSTHEDLQQAVQWLRTKAQEQEWVRLLLHQVLEKEAAVMKVQRWYRRVLRRIDERELQRHEYELARNNRISACILLQRWWRLQLKKQHRIEKEGQFLAAALTIEAWWRGTQQRMFFQLQKDAERNMALLEHAVTMLQAAHRGRITRAELLYQTQCATAIQSHVRGFYRRQRISAELEHGNATTIQSWYRASVAMHEYKIKWNACITLQSFARRLVALEVYHSMKENLSKNAATTDIQRISQGYLLRSQLAREHLAAVSIQSVFRGHQAQLLYHKKLALEGSAVKVQSWWRCVAAFESYQRAQIACIILQSFARRLLALEVYHSMKENLSKNAATTDIQRISRGYLLRLQLAREHLAAVPIQSVFRGYQAQLLYQQELVLERSAVKVQSWWRCVAALESYQKHLHAFILIQSLARQKLALSQYQTRKRLSQMDDACIVIQGTLRGYLALQKLQKHATCAAMIQAAWLGHAQYSLYKRQLQTCIIFQSLARRKRDLAQASSLRWELQQRRLHSSSEAVQRVFRGYAVRRDISSWNSAATKVQGVWRMHKMCQRYQCQLYAIVRLQTLARRAQVRRLFIARIRQQQEDLRRAEEDRLMKAIVQIQRVLRGSVCFNRFQRSKQAAVRVQSWFRCHSLQRRYQEESCSNILLRSMKLRRDWAATIIQRLYREILLRRKIIQRQVALRRAATVLQASSRRYFTLKKFQASRASALLLQSWMRRQMSRVVRSLEIQALIRLQTFSRRIIAVQKYTNARVAAVLTQALWRKHMAVALFKKQKVAALRLQACFRAFLARTSYDACQSAIVLLQALWRKEKLSSLYLKMRKRVTMLQALARRHYVSKRYKCVLASTSRVQAFSRMLMARRLFSSQRNAIILCQKVARAHLARSRFARVRGAASRIQSLIRLRIAKSTAREERAQNDILATRIQSTVRRWTTRRKLESWKRSSVVIQAFLRMINDRSWYKRRQNGARVLQSWLRGTIARSYLHRGKGAACVIQNCYRSHLHRTNYISLRGSVVSIQALARTFMIRQMMHKRASAALAIQNVWFARKRRMALLDTHGKHQKLVTLIQCHIRVFLARKALQKNITCAITLQSSARMLAHRSAYLMAKRGSIKLQSIVRMKMALSRFQLIKSSAIHVQAFLRKHFSQTLKEQKRLLIENGAAHVVQSTWVSYRYRCVRCRVMETKAQAAVEIQAFLRMAKLRSSFRDAVFACVVLQTSFRRFRAQSKYKQVQISALLIETQWRMASSRRRYLASRNAVVKVQNSFRSYSSRRSFLDCKASAIQIECAFRAYLCRRHIYFESIAAGIIQRNWRERKRMSFVKMMGQHNSLMAMRIQSCARAWRLRAEFKKERLKSAAILQAFVRLSSVRTLFLRAKVSCVIIQSLVRRNIARRSFLALRASTIFLQSLVRRVLDREAFLRAKLAVLIQTQLRSVELLQGFFRSRKLRQSYLKAKKATVLLQALVRMRQRSLHWQFQQKAVVQIQRFVRCRLDRARFCHTIRSVILLQSFWTAHYIRRVEKERKEDAAVNKVIRIQSFARMSMVRGGFATKRNALVVLQCFARMLASRKSYHHVLSSTIVIQSLLRSFLVRKLCHHQLEAAVSLQSLYRGHAVNKKMQSLPPASRKIQALARGYVARRQIFRHQAAAVSIQRAWLICKKRSETLAEKRLERHIRKMLIQRSSPESSACSLGSLSWYSYRTYIRTKKAIIRLQSMSRAKRAHSTFCKAKASATVLESYWRMISCQQRYSSLRRAAILIQQAYKQHRMLHKSIQSAIMLQNWWRQTTQIIRSREEYTMKAAILVQSNWRRYASLVAYASHRASAAIIQSAYRRHRHRREFRLAYNGAIRLQSHFRRVHAEQRSVALAAEKSLEAYKRREEACILIQCTIRGCMGRQIASKRAVRARKEAAQGSPLHGIIQNVIRRHLVSHQVSLAQRQGILYGPKAVLIQMNFRKYQSRKRSVQRDEIRKAALILQCAWRSSLARTVLRARKYQEATRVRAEASLKIQSLVRRRLVYRQVALYKRQQREQREFALALKGIVTIQCSWRVRTARKITRKLSVNVKARHNASVLLQTAFRHYLTLRQIAMLRSQESAAVKIQSTVRSRQVRVVYSFIREEAITIQSAMRTYLTQTKERKRQAAVRIQSFLRMHQVRMVYRFIQREVMTIQSVARHFLASGRLESAYNRNQQIRNDLSEKEYRRASEAAEKEVVLLLSGDRPSLESAGICLRRLVNHVMYFRFLEEARENELGKAKAMLFNVQRHCH